MKANGNGTHDHFQERKSAGCCSRCRIRAAIGQLGSSRTAENPSKDTSKACPQWRDDGNPDRQAVAVPRVRLERMAGKNRELNNFHDTRVKVEPVCESVILGKAVGAV